MSEGEITSELISKERWVPITRLPSLGFYVGAQYLGAYRNRLEIDVNAIEAVCREADLPPVVIASDTSYQPPPPITPEMVGPGQAAFKKLSFSGPENVRGKKDTPSLVLIDSTKETIYDARSRVDIPIGYQLRLKDRKILHDYQQKHPSASLEEIERKFVSSFDRGLRQGIPGIALIDKTIYYRDLMSGERAMPNQAKLDGAVRFLSRWLGQLPSLMLGLTPPVASLMGQDSPKLAKAVITGIATMSGTQALMEQLMKRIDAATIARELGSRLHGSYAYHASNEWRQENFPDRFPKEHMGLSPKVDEVFGLIPLSTVLKPLYIASYALSRHPKPLVRLR